MNNITPDDLREMRSRYSVTQQMAAERVGVSTRTWKRWEGGEIDIPLSRQKHMRAVWPLGFPQPDQ